jgi:hypothetical protein
MPAHPISVIGLVLGMLGVVIIFIWGPPQPDFQDTYGPSSGSRMPDGRTAREHADDHERLKRRHNRLSRIGLGLIFIGFAFQLCDAWRS